MVRKGPSAVYRFGDKWQGGGAVGVRSDGGRGK